MKLLAQVPSISEDLVLDLVSTTIWSRSGCTPLRIRFGPTNSSTHKLIICATSPYSGYAYHPLLIDITSRPRCKMHLNIDSRINNIMLSIEET